MFTHYLRITARTLARYRGHTLTNVSGLAVGLACCLLIQLFVRHEWSFDRFHANADRLYRAWVLEDYGENEVFFNTTTPVPLAAALESSFPEVEETVRIDAFTDVVQRGDAAFTERVVLADPAFFDVFDFPIRAGDRPGLLNDPGGVILTPAVATRYFGDGDPIGQALSITIRGTVEAFVVQAVAEPVPASSSIQFDLLIPFRDDLYSEGVRRSWTNVSPETYVLLRDGVRAEAMADKLPSMVQQIMGDRYVEGQYTVGLQPITDIHLNPAFPAGFSPVSDPAYAYILSAIALLVLFIAGINFVTLSIGRSAARALEVGVRKVVGARRRQLMAQFWGEALLVTGLALVLGVVLAELCLPLFNDLAGRTLTLTLDGGTLLFLAALWAGIGLVAGSYPAALLSGFRPMDVLKGTLRLSGDTSLLRRGLVIVQFALSIFLIAGTLVMSRQLHFLQTKNLGFDKEQVVILPTGLPVDDGMQRAERMRNALAGQDAVAGLTAASYPLDEGWLEMGYTAEDGTYREFFFNRVDPEFLATMRMDLVAGRDFSRDIPSDERRAVIVNEALVREYGWDNPIGQHLPGARFPDHEIIGVVRDFNFESLRQDVRPAVLALSFDLDQGVENVESRSSPRPDIAVRLASDDLPGAVALLETTWTRVAPGQPFDYRFLDQSVDSQYREEQRLGRIVGIASLLAVGIACLGLFGLAALTVVRRTKEIGVRKVLGASVPHLVVLLSKDFALLVGVAFALAAPAAYLALDVWLQDFAFRIDISVWIFLSAGLVALGVALLTVSYQSVRAARADPVKSLRYE